MIKGKTILAIIPARGGSKGLPGKNIKDIAGKPLIAWSIEQGKKSKYIDRLIVSTDDKEIANVSEKYGADVPFLRPSKYAQDDSPSFEAVLHAINSFKQVNELFDYIVLLEPTSPLRGKDDIDSAIEIFSKNDMADSLISVGEIHTEHPSIVKKIDKNGIVVPYVENVKKIYQRQQADKAYFPYGVIYVCKTKIYQEQKSFYTKRTLPFFIERWQNYEIDDYIDFLIIEKLLMYNKEKING